MTNYQIFGAALALSAAIVAAPASAWEAIQEPGAYSFYHPNSDLGLGSSRPADAFASTARSDLQLSVKTHRVHRAGIKRN